MASDGATSSRTSAACDDMVRQFGHTFADVWRSGATGLPDLGRTYTLSEQREREAILEHFQGRLIAEIETPPRRSADLIALQARLLPDIYATILPAFDIDAGSIDADTGRCVVREAVRFVQAARRFDSAIAGDDIYQASRNVWTMFALQYLLGAPVVMTPSIFAYGLLYPYTDNYLDDPAVARPAKIAFNERLGRRLRGDPVAAANQREQRVFDLIAMIEDQYPFRQYPQIFESLRAIHGAQLKDVQLAGRSPQPSEHDVLTITLEKGGTSVLADGYLVAGDMSVQQAEFLFGWGALMQLVDDMQDVESDSRAGAVSLYTLMAANAAGRPLFSRLLARPERWPGDALANRSFHFAFAVMERLDGFAVSGAQPVSRFMKRAVIMLMAGAIARSRSLYSPSYLSMVEQHLPVRSRVVSRRGALSRGQSTLRRLVESFAASDEGQLLVEEVLA
jgi:hypothetical protein